MPTRMQTANGHSFDLMVPRAEDVDWENVANSLSRICRFGGHIPLATETYTVGQHCCLVHDLLPVEHKLRGLIHDAHEAYWGDDIRPKKRALKDASAGLQYLAVERPIEDAIYAAAGLSISHQGGAGIALKHADAVLLATEKRDILAEPQFDWEELPEPMKETIEPWHRLRVYSEWMHRFNVLMRR